MNSINTKSSKIKHFFIVLWFVVKLSLISFGGGNAMMPIAYQQAVEKKKWLEKHEFDDVVVMANLLPGPSSLQMLAYISIKQLGRWLGIFACLLAFIPHVILALVLLYLVQLVPQRYLLVANIGIISTIVGVLIGFSIKYFKSNHKSLSTPLFYAILIGTFCYCFFIPSPYNLSLVALLVLIIIYSIYYWIKKRRGNKC
ncbi:chromate transporter [Mesomycoplasma bovoculi]|uniref:Chromate transport protein n=1 Tax=Mesomycoplasma bovoculi M165/69 TaxID=743966 RepID=W5V149_9BACT|nr:chromate transporter [Mesomycoplasma bovoculi]AHH45463.1 chromate transport protein [Mesomycoplasma bovoculi M165/69]